MPRIIHRVDAFADGPHKGNLAAVYLLHGELTEQELQNIATYADLPLTAFIKKARDQEGSAVVFDIRWFTRKCEVDLCGHGTLAATYYLYQSFGLRNMTFHSKSGPLMTSITDEDKVKMNFPTQVTSVCDATMLTEIENLLGCPVRNVHFGYEDYLIELPSSKAVVDFKPVFDKIAAFDCRGIIITAWDEAYGYDCVSRFFCPKVAINEDQVCVSAHCKIMPYWQVQKGITTLHAWQASANSGVLHLSAIDKDRVQICGTAQMGREIIMA